MEDINALSPIFREVVLYYLFSNRGSYNEEFSINYIVENYSFIFKTGGEEICYPYIDVFFEELINRQNNKHIERVQDMFGGISVNKSKNRIYQRFVIILSKHRNK